MKNPKVYEVEWLDTSSFGGWNHRTQDAAENSQPLRSFSVGYLLVRDEERIVLAQSHVDRNDTVGETLCIPRGCVVRVRLLHHKGR